MVDVVVAVNSALRTALYRRLPKMRRTFLLLIPTLALIMAGCSVSDPSGAMRTVAVSMSDDMRYVPAEFEFVAGETVRFEVANAGSVRHEFYVADLAAQQEHAAEMTGDGHGTRGSDEPGLVSVEPGAIETLEYTFATAGELFAACHEPGHYEAGMIARISVRAGS